MASANLNNKCARKQEHDWERYKDVRDVIIYKCAKCKGHKWVTRRN